jgi:NAD+ synthase (glutamine-hydrolysing)
MSRFAFSEGTNLILMNQVGGSGDIVYDGTSGILNCEGRLVMLLNSFEEDFRIFDTEAENKPFDVPFTTYKDRNSML